MICMCRKHRQRRFQLTPSPSSFVAKVAFKLNINNTISRENRNQAVQGPTTSFFVTGKIIENEVSLMVGVHVDYGIPI